GVGRLSGRARGDPGRPPGASVVGVDPPGAPDPGAAVGTRHWTESGRGVEAVTGGTERVVVVGGDAAGMSAASQAKRLRGDKLEAVAFERGAHSSYSACGIPSWGGGGG